MIVICVVVTVMTAKGVAGRLRGRRGESWVAAASRGLIDGFEALGPTFVKLGQLVASSPGVFPGPLANAALRCLDEVRPFPAEVASEMIARDLGKPPWQIFRHFDEHPLSAASIGQVHACVLPDGREAVIKLQRPDIRERMATDLRIMHRLARMLERRTKIGRSVNAVGVIEDLHAVTFQELNPAVEALRQARFRQNVSTFGDNAHVTVPEVFWEYCGPHMICMERMSGVPLDDFDTIRRRGVDGELVLRRTIKVWVEAAFVHGPFHGDLHAGNIWVLDDGRAAFLDFGIMGELEPEWRLLLQDLFMTTMIDGDWTRIVRAFRRVGAVDGAAGTDEEIAARFELAFGPMLDTGLSDISIGEVLRSIVQMMDQVLGGTPRELLLIVKQFLYFERYSKELAPSWTIARDLFLVRNIFSEEVGVKCTELGIKLPD